MSAIPPQASWTLPTEMNSQEITAKSKSNFILSFLLLPKARRQGMVNFYALSRVIDDAVDDYEISEAKVYLNFWKKEIEACYSGQPTHPITQAMQETIQTFKIPKNYLDLLIEGCEQDLYKKKYNSLTELREYCFRVASVIGLISMKIFGVHGKISEEAAEEMGLALQYTNILRDIAEDAKIGRIYLPQEDIKRYRLSEEQVTQGKPFDKKLKILLKLQADRAETHFEKAFTLMRKLPRRPLVAAWIMGKVYYKILKKIRAKHYNIYSKKIKISKLSKLWILLSESIKSIFFK
ncbi:MAG: squalene/phytoene synthase family protein [Deltaproteobacteria bacterium]|nr:squalene/phytoene synthase family protein [Deltaproteobacteria bacterium]